MGQRLPFANNGESPCEVNKNELSMAMFHSKLLVYQRVVEDSKGFYGFPSADPVYNYSNIYYINHDYQV